MSLINDALKKAQRLRTEDPLAAAPPMPGGSARVAKRAQPRTPQQLVLIAAGVVVLVVLTVVATVWLVNRPTAPKPEPVVAASPAPKPATDVSARPPIIVAPVISPAPVPVAASPVPPATASKPAAPPSAAPRASVPAPAVSQSTPPPPAAVVPAAVSEAPVAAATEPLPAAPTPPAGPQSNERIHVFVDAIRVTAIRSAGDDSRVQMNDRVFRINDTVDRTFDLRLTKVEPHILTFTDANGVTYVKNF